jgi:segregation and condensation protein A
MLPAGEREADPIFAPSKDLTLAALGDALAAALAAIEEQEELPETRVKPTVTIEEMMDSLLTRVQQALTISFKDFSGKIGGRVEVIVSFLAMLELVKQGAIDAAQQAQFGDIKLTNTSSSVPRY